MVNAVSSISVVSPTGSPLRAAAPAPAPAPAPTPIRAPAPPEKAPDPSVIVTISARANAPADAAASRAASRAAAPADQQAAAAQAAAAQTSNRIQLAAAPEPLSLDPRPMQYTPILAYQPADVNEEGHVTPAEQQNYEFHHPSSGSRLAAEADSAYEAIARDT